MPDRFREACPVCGSSWTQSTTDTTKHRITCSTCKDEQVKNGLPVTWDADSGAYVPDVEWAWRKLWRAYVQRYGLLRGVYLVYHQNRGAACLT
jgi:hypothetical protein